MSNFPKQMLPLKYYSDSEVKVLRRSKHFQMQIYWIIFQLWESFLIRESPKCVERDIRSRTAAKMQIDLTENPKACQMLKTDFLM